MSIEIQIRGIDLEAAIKRVTAAAGTDQQLPILTGVHIAISGANDKGARELTFTATDRYVLARMVVNTLDDERGADPFTNEMVVPVKALPKINPRDTYTLTFGPTHALSVADSTGAVYVVPELDGEYPKLAHLFVPALEGVISAPALFSIGDKQLGQLVKMSAGLKGNGINFAFTVEGGAAKAMVVTFTAEPRFWALVMPRRV